MASRDERTGDETGVAEATRVCPSCNEARPDSTFRSKHPRTHCDVCRAAKAAGSPASSSEDGADPTRGEAASSDVAARTEETSEGALPGNKVAPSSEPPAASPRHRRMRLACPEAPLECPVLGIELDVSPRAHAGHRPVEHVGVWMSTRAAELLTHGPDPDELDLVAEWLRTREA